MFFFIYLAIVYYLKIFNSVQAIKIPFFVFRESSSLKCTKRFFREFFQKIFPKFYAGRRPRHKAMWPACACTACVFLFHSRRSCTPFCSARSRRREAEPKVRAGDANRKLPHSSIFAASSSILSSFLVTRWLAPNRSTVIF